jgi:hypothetical protein
MSTLTCSGCIARERQLADLRGVLQHMQRELRAQLGTKTVAILDAMEGQPPLTPAEIAKRAKATSEAGTKVVLDKLKDRGLVKRTSWRDRPGHRWPAPEYQIVGAREVLNGSNGKQP